MDRHSFHCQQILSFVISATPKLLDVRKQGDIKNNLFFAGDVTTPSENGYCKIGCIAFLAGTVAKLQDKGKTPILRYFDSKAKTETKAGQSIAQLSFW